MGFLRRFVCGCGTKSLPLDSPKYESCVPSTITPFVGGHDETWAPGRWACSPSPVGAKKSLKQMDGTCMSEASTELPGAIMDSPRSSINAVLPFGFNPDMPFRELPSQMTRAHTAPPQSRPRVTYFSDNRRIASGQRRKAPPPLFMAMENKSPLSVVSDPLPLRPQCGEEAMQSN